MLAAGARLGLACPSPARAHPGVWSPAVARLPTPQEPQGYPEGVERRKSYNLNLPSAPIHSTCEFVSFFLFQ